MSTSADESCAPTARGGLVKPAGRARRALRALARAAVPAVVAAGCAEPLELGTEASAVTVGAAVGGGCSTAVVLGLSRQIADELACASPSSLASFEGAANVVLTSNAVLPYLDPGAREGLLATPGTVQINSAFRTVAQQYLLYRWYQQGRCGISAAATPGRSNHETGRAIDVSNYASKISSLRAHGWAHDVPGDPVHFDHTASPDLRGRDVAAFQSLWNRNHPGDLIGVDGSYGPATASRLAQAPATGFPIGATCGGRATPAARLDQVLGPDLVPGGGRAHYALTITNGGAVAWPATTELAAASGQPSALYDAASWISASTVLGLGREVPAGTAITIQLDVAAPAVTEPTPAREDFALVDGGRQLGVVTLAFTATPPGFDPAQQSLEGDEAGVEPPDVDADAGAGGCQAGGDAGLAGLAPLALLALRRRRKGR